MHPTLNIEDGKIGKGYKSLAKQILGEKQIIIDDYISAFFTDFQEKLDKEFHKLGNKVNWKSTDQALKLATEINQLIELFLGGDDPIFGTRTTLQLADL